MVICLTHSKVFLPVGRECRARVHVVAARRVCNYADFDTAFSVGIPNTYIKYTDGLVHIEAG